MPQAKTEVVLQFSESCVAEAALQHSLVSRADAILNVFTKSCAASSKKLHGNVEKAALQESGAFLPLSCGCHAPTLGLADLPLPRDNPAKCSCLVVVSLPPIY